MSRETSTTVQLLGLGTRAVQIVVPPLGVYYFGAEGFKAGALYTFAGASALNQVLHCIKSVIQLCGNNTETRNNDETQALTTHKLESTTTEPMLKKVDLALNSLSVIAFVSALVPINMEVFEKNKTLADSFGIANTICFDVHAYLNFLLLFINSSRQSVTLLNNLFAIAGAAFVIAQAVVLKHLATSPAESDKANHLTVAGCLFLGANTALGMFNLFKACQTKKAENEPTLRYGAA